MPDEVLPHAPWERPLTRSQLDAAIVEAEAKLQAAGSPTERRRAFQESMVLKGRKSRDLRARTDSQGRLLSPEEALRRQVAREHALPAELAARLTGETREELEADAQKLAAQLSPPTP